MKVKVLFLMLAASFLFSLSAQAQHPNAIRKVRNVEMQDLDGKKARLPWWGEKNLILFYVDPDKAKQNHEFTVYIEETKRLVGPNIEGFGIINLKDSWYPVPDSVVRQIAEARTAKNGATILCDPDHWLSSAWRLGECNDFFVTMLITKQGELVYIHKGEMSKADQEEFLRIADTLR
jgi:hypothetical protein